MRRVLSRYIRFIEHFYRREFIEIFLHPHPRSRLVKVILVMLAGNTLQALIAGGLNGSTSSCASRGGVL